MFSLFSFGHSSSARALICLNTLQPKVKASDFKYSVLKPHSNAAPLEDQMLHTLVAATSDYLRDKSHYPTCPIGDPDED